MSRLHLPANVGMLLACTCFIARAQTNPRSIYERGQQYWQLSFRAFNDLQKTAPTSVYSLALRGEEKLSKRQYTAALDALNEAAGEMPNLRGLHALMAEVYRSQGNQSAASDAEQAEQRLGPPKCAAEKLWCDFAAGKFDAVVNDAGAKPAPERLYWLAKAYRQLAVETFAQLDAAPESAELHEVRAKVLQNEHRYSDAAVELRAALKLKPGDPGLERELAATLFLTEDYKVVLPELQELLRAQPESANLNFFVGDTLLETDHAEQAAPYLETALKLDPALTPAHVALGLCYEHLGDDQKALPHLEAGLALDQDGRVHYLLARAYKKMGQLERADEMMKKYKQIKTAAASK